MNDKLAIGEFATIRRYKDLCCEYQVFNTGTIIAPRIFSHEYIRCCGHSFKILQKGRWGEDYGYRLANSNDSDYWFKDFLLESEPAQFPPF